MMVIQTCLERSFLLIALSLVLSSVVHAKGTQMFVCTGSDGVRTYQNSDGGKGCVPLNLNPITVVPTPKSGMSKDSEEIGVLGVARKRSGITDDRTSGDFNSKDDRMKILQEELRIEESKQKSLQDEYKGGQPDRLGSERNYQKYLDRVSRLEQELMVTNDNIDILKAELTRLSK